MTSYHFIGIGGAGMSVVAELLAAQGHHVQGSDAHDTSTLAQLRGIGIPCFVGHDAAHVPADAVVVVSTAIRETNPELAAARARHQRILHRSRALDLAAAGKHFVAVAGAHGKTTTSAMIAFALTQLGMDPSYAIGGTVRQVGRGAHLGAGDVFVAEADESDASFLNYRPWIAVVTNVEADHLDRYGSAAAVQQAFAEFVALVRPGGAVVACADDPGARQLLALADRPAAYGRDVSGDRDDVRVTGAGLKTAAGFFPLQLRIPGAHNMLNAAAALATLRLLGADDAEAVSALAQFEGAGRRFELRGQRSGVTVVDDYAHHPTEVAATIAAARERTAGRVGVLFQPHLFSRTKSFATQFAHALDAADLAVVTDIYAAREDPDPAVTSRLITDRMARGHYEPDKVRAARELAQWARPGDLLLTMGAGDVTEMANVILEAL